MKILITLKVHKQFFCENTYSTGSLKFFLLLLKDIIIGFIFFKLLLATVQQQLPEVHCVTRLVCHGYFQLHPHGKMQKWQDYLKKSNDFLKNLFSLLCKIMLTEPQVSFLQKIHNLALGISSFQRLRSFKFYIEKTHSSHINVLHPLWLVVPLADFKILLILLQVRLHTPPDLFNCQRLLFLFFKLLQQVLWFQETNKNEIKQGRTSWP